MRKLAIVFTIGIFSCFYAVSVGNAQPAEPDEPETPDSFEPDVIETEEPMMPDEGAPVLPDDPTAPTPTLPGDAPADPEKKAEVVSTELDRQYWQDIKVVARKLILKQQRLEINLNPFGMTLNDNLIRHWFLGAEVNYFLSEAMSVGVSGQYYIPDITQRAYLMGLQQRVLPTLNQYHFTTTANFNYNWMYGKFALHNWFIQQFGGFVGAGVGVTMTSVIPRRAGDSSWNNYNFTIMFPSIGIRMFIFQWLTVNLGVRLYIMRDVFEASNRPADDDPTLPPGYDPKSDGAAPRWIPNLVFSLGLSFFLPPTFEYRQFR